MAAADSASPAATGFVSDAHIKLVKDSWKALDPHWDSAAMLMFYHLWDKAPETKKLFSDLGKHAGVTDEAVAAAFKKFDADGNGLVSPEELKGVIKQFGAELDDKAIEEIVAAADIDGDGHINYTEFVAVKSQNKRLHDMLNAVVGMLDDNAGLEAKLVELGKRHVRYGAKKEHYKPFNESLFEVLDAGLGKDGCTKAVKEAWGAVLEHMGSIMQAQRCEVATGDVYAEIIAHVAAGEALTNKALAGDRNLDESNAHFFQLSTGYVTIVTPDGAATLDAAGIKARMEAKVKKPELANIAGVKNRATSISQICPNAVNVVLQSCYLDKDGKEVSQRWHHILYTKKGGKWGAQTIVRMGV